jgi:exonuclease SbcD
MDEITILTAGDIHISDTNPRSRTDNFKETILGKLDQLRIASVKLKADAVLLAGDIFNLKSPIKNSHDLNRELIELFKKFKCPVYSIPGNHDLTADNIETMGSQPISVLFASGALKNLNHEIISKKKLKISLVGIPFTKNLDLKKLNIPPKDDATTQICVMHIYAGPHAGNLFKERLYGYDELSELSPDIFVLGHYHEDQGIQKQQEKYFINLGSLSRGTLTNENIQHNPKFGFIKIIKENDECPIEIKVDSIPVKIKPAEEIFDLKKRDEEKIQDIEIQKYVERLVSESVVLDKRTSIDDHLSKMNIEKEVHELVTNLIEEAILNRSKK